jgi:hypothetical protein
MIIALLRSRNTFWQLMLFLIIAVAAWAPIFLHKTEILHHDVAPLYRSLTHLLEASPQWVVKLTVVFAQLFLLLVVSVNINRIGLLSGKNTPVLFVFFLAVNALPGAVTVNPQLFALLFIVPSITVLLLSFKEQNPYQRIFNAGFWAGLAALVYVPALLMLVLAWVALLILRLYNIRLWIINTVALVLPAGYLLLFAWIFGYEANINEALKMLQSVAMSWPLALHADYYSALRVSEIFTVISFLTIFLFSFYRVFLRLNERVIIERRFYKIVIWYLIIFLLGIVFSGGHPYSHLLLLSFGAALFVGECFILAKRTRLLDILLILFCFSLIFSRLHIF